MLTLKSYTVRPNSDLIDCLISTEVSFGSKIIVVERTIQLSQRILLNDNPAWTDEDLRTACAEFLSDEVILSEKPAAEISQLELN